MYDRQINNYLANLLIFAERLTNCKLSLRERKVRTQSVNHHKEQSICTNSNNCSQPTRVELGAALLHAKQLL